jgi:hypothetical protein
LILSFKSFPGLGGESAYKGFEILMAICRSALERRPIPLPLEPGEPEIERLAGIL